MNITYTTAVFAALLIVSIIYIINLYNRIRDKSYRGDQQIMNNEISIAITNILFSAKKNTQDFEYGMINLASKLRESFKCEYCAIGKVVEQESVIFEDFAVSYEEKESLEDREMQKKAMGEVKLMDSSNSDLFLCDSFLKEGKIVIYNKKQIQKRKVRNQNFALYESQILKSKKVNDITVIKISNDGENLGYIQLINSSVKIVEEDISFSNHLSVLIRIAKENDEEKRKLEEKTKLAKDTAFITNLLLDKTTKQDAVNYILENISMYLSGEFDAPIISFRIPVLNDKDKHVLFYLRHIYIAEDINNKNEVLDYYIREREVVDYKQVGGNGYLKCFLPNNLKYVDINDTGFYREFELENFKTSKGIILPVLKEVDNKCCLDRHDSKQCMPTEISNCKKKYRNLYGLFKLRINNEDKNLPFLEQRLKNLSILLSFLFDSIIDKKDASNINIFQKELNKIDLIDTDNLDKLIANLIKNVTKAKVCSIYRHWAEENDGLEFLHQTASTSAKILVTRNGSRNITSNTSKMDYPIDESNVLSRVYKKRKSKYLYSLQNEVDKLDSKYLECFFPYYIDIPDYNIVDENEIISLIKKESIFIQPILTRKNECIGVILLIGRENDEYNISTSYWEQDRIFIEFLMYIMSRFFDIKEADVEKEKFLNQLGHELLTPITEMSHQNNNILLRYKRNKYIGEKDSIKIIEDNLNAISLFKQIIDDIELAYENEDLILNKELIEKPQKVILDVVQLLEKQASADKQITVKTNISEMPPIVIDKNKMKQVFINLLKNAIQYSENYSTIDIYYKEVLHNNKRWHEIKFSNYGIGVLEKDKDKIFHLYQRSWNAKKVRPSGTGIGLYVVKKIIEAHGGMSLVLRLNSPTQIAVYLPFY